MSPEQSGGRSSNWGTCHLIHSPKFKLQRSVTGFSRPFSSLKLLSGCVLGTGAGGAPASLPSMFAGLRRHVRASRGVGEERAGFVAEASGPAAEPGSPCGLAGSPPVAWAAWRPAWPLGVIGVPAEVCRLPV